MSSDKKIENILFVQRLKELMKEKHYTQQSLSNYSKDINCYVSRKTISLWCIGKAYPTRNNIKFLCDTFDVTPEYLFGQSEYRNEIEHVSALSNKVVVRLKLYNKIAEMILNDDVFSLLSDMEKDNMVNDVCNYIAKNYFNKLVLRTRKNRKGESKNGSD